MVPNKWETFLAGGAVCPFCSFCLWFFLGWLFTAIAVGKLHQEGTDIIAFERNDVKSDPLVQQYYAFEKARGEQEGCTDQAHNVNKETCERDTTCEWDETVQGIGRGATPIRCKTKSMCTQPALRMRETPLIHNGGAAWISVLYEAEDGGNILDDGTLETIRKFEQKLLTTVGGATLTDGSTSPWNRDWCIYAYPDGPRNSTGRCAAPVTVTNLFAMTDEGTRKTAEQVREGFSLGGKVFACMCSDADALCEICNADGSLKGFQPATGTVDTAQWPADMVACMRRELLASAAMAASEAATTNVSSKPVCQKATLVSEAQVAGVLSGLCKSKPSCQWAPPHVSAACSSTSFYHATDLTGGLAKGAEKEQALSKICDPTDPGWSSLRRALLPAGFDCSTKRTSFARMWTYAGGTGSSTEGDEFEQNYIKGASGWFAKEQQLEREFESESGGSLRMMLFSPVTLRSQYLDILLVDGVLSVLSLVAVWSYMFWTLESAFLASVAMFEIVFSLPVAIFFWTVILQQKIFFYQALTIYMILGIGADDAFILNDAWLQASLQPEVGSEKTARFSWAYRRAFEDMSITTATTCGSFFIGAASSLPQVRAFCIFAAVVVLVDWLFCITLFASAIMLYDRYLVSNKAPGVCCGPGCCCGCVRAIAASCCGGKMPLPGGKRPLERFCEGPLYNLLSRARWILIPLWVAIIGAMAAVAGAALRTAEKPPPLGRRSLDAIRGYEILLQEFSVSAVPTTSFVYGLDAAEPVVKWDAAGHADEVRFSAAEAARVTTPEGQLELLRLCQAADLGEERCEDPKCLILGKPGSGRCVEEDASARAQGVYWVRLEGQLCASAI